MILERTNPAALANLDGHRTAHDIPRSQILGVGGIAFHEPLAVGIRQVPALAAAALGDQATRAVDAGRMKLHELHVLQRQPGAQHHAAAIASAGVGRGAGKICAAVAAGGQYGHLRAKAMQLAGGQIDRHHAPALALLHEQIDREVFNIELGLVADRLLIQRVQQRMSGAIGGGAGSLGDTLAVMSGHTAKGALINAAIIRARERHAVVLELNHRGGRLLAHELDGILIAEPVRAFDGVIHMPSPVVLAHVAQRRADAALCGDSVTAGGKYLGHTGGRQPGFGQTQGRAQAGTAGANDHHIVGVIDKLVGTHAALRSAMRSTAYTPLAASRAFTNADSSSSRIFHPCCAT